MKRINLAKPGAAKAAMDHIRWVAAVLGPEGGDPVLRAAADIAVREMKLELSKPGTGRTYTTEFWVDSQNRLHIGKQRPPHTASAPGEPPAPDSGDLHDSIVREIRDGTAYIGTPLAYGRYLEYGFNHVNGTQVAPRPWARPVAERLRDILPREVAVVAGKEITVRLRSAA